MANGVVQLVVRFSCYLVFSALAYKRQKGNFIGDYQTYWHTRTLLQHPKKYKACLKKSGGNSCALLQTCYCVRLNFRLFNLFSVFSLPLSLD